VLAAAWVHWWHRPACAAAVVSPPESLPGGWLHDRLSITYGFVFITAAMLYVNYRQYHQRTISNKAKIR